MLGSRKLSEKLYSSKKKCYKSFQFHDTIRKELQKLGNAKIHHQLFVDKIKILDYTPKYYYIIPANFNESSVMIKYQAGKYRTEYEYLIGLQVNQLRKVIPNFMFTYGKFTCGEVLRDKNEEGKEPILSWCGDPVLTGYQDYLLLEDISGFGISEFVINNDLPGFFNAYLQVVLSVYTAYQKINFKHRDAHPGNVIMKPCDEKSYIKYDTPLGVLYLRSKNIATLIDFGESRVIPPSDPEKEKILSLEKLVSSEKGFSEVSLDSGFSFSDIFVITDTLYCDVYSHNKKIFIKLVNKIVNFARERKYILEGGEFTGRYNEQIPFNFPEFLSFLLKLGIEYNCVTWKDDLDKEDQLIN